MPGRIPTAASQPGGGSSSSHQRSVALLLSEGFSEMTGRYIHDKYLILFDICYIRWFIDTMLIPIGCCDVYTSWHTFKGIKGPLHFLLPGLAVHSS